MSPYTKATVTALLIMTSLVPIGAAMRIRGLKQGNYAALFLNAAILFHYGLAALFVIAMWRYL